MQYECDFALVPWLLPAAVPGDESQCLCELFKERVKGESITSRCRQSIED